MAIDKNRVKARFRTNFRNVALSNKRLDEISAKLAIQLPDDAEDSVIDSKLDDLNDIYPFSEIQKSDDRAVNDKKKEEEVTPPKTDDDDENDSMKLLLNEFKSLKAELSTFRQEKTKETIADRFGKEERLKGVPKFILSKFAPDNEEAYEEAVIALETEYKSFAEKEKLGSFGKDYVPSGNGGSKADIKAKTADETADLAKSI